MTGSRILLSLLTLAVTATGQDQIGPPQDRGRRLLDEVVAVIGDRVILKSQLDAEVAARVGDRELSREELDQLRRQSLLAVAREQIWIEHGRAAGDQSPEAFEQLVEQRVQERIRQEIRTSGSLLQLDEEMGMLGKSWAELRRQERNQVLQSIGRSTIVAPLLFSQGLMITPEEIRRFFDEHPEQFQRPASADVASIAIPIEGGDVAAAQARALEAAAAWRTEGLGSAALAARFGALDLGVTSGVTADGEWHESLTEFAQRGAIGDVSEPIQRSSRSITIMRIVDKVDAISREFSNPAVQAGIRDYLINERAIELQNEILDRKARNIYSSIPGLLFGS